MRARLAVRVMAVRVMAAGAVLKELVRCVVYALWSELLTKCTCGGWRRGVVGVLC